MSAQDILHRLADLGVEVCAIEGRIRLMGHATIPADLVAAIREHRDEVLALLEQEARDFVEADQAIEAPVAPMPTEEPTSAQDLREQREPQGLDQAEAHHADQDFEAEVARRVAAFSDQANRPGGISFMTLPGAPERADGCLSCGGALPASCAYRCPACAEAARRVLAERPHHAPQDAPGGPPATRPAGCPACGQGGLWKRAAAPGDAFCVRCGTVCEPTGPGPPPRPGPLPHRHHEEEHRDETQASRYPGPGVLDRRPLRVLVRR